jgi:hypothetical protein
MKFCRIDLSKTNYDLMLDSQWKYVNDRNTTLFNQIYKEYCQFKKFDSVMPMFESQDHSQLQNDLESKNLSNQ